MFYFYFSRFASLFFFRLLFLCVYPGVFSPLTKGAAELSAVSQPANRDSSLFSMPSFLGQVKHSISVHQVFCSSNLPASQQRNLPFGFFCLYLCVGGSQVSSLVRAPAGLVIERLRIRILAGMAGEVLSPESTLCADSYSVSVPPLCYRSGT